MKKKHIIISLIAGIVVIAGVFISVYIIWGDKISDAVQTKTATAETDNPPGKYLKNLKNCSPMSSEVKSSGSVYNYEIVGYLSDGRCKVKISSYTDYSNPDVYEMYKTFGGKHTKEELMEHAKNSPDVTVCRFTSEQTEAMIKAAKSKDDNTEESSYEQLLSVYDGGTCIVKN